MFKPAKETVERINKIYETFAELSSEVDKVIQELKPLADMENLDHDTDRLIYYTDLLNTDFTSAFIASEELTLILTGILDNQE